MMIHSTSGDQTSSSTSNGETIVGPNKQRLPLNLSKDALVFAMNSNPKSPTSIPSETLTRRGIKRQRAVVVAELGEVCSIDRFRATPLAEYRFLLQRCLKENVRRSSLESGMDQCVTYDRIDLSQKLKDNINWKTLCEHYDIHNYKFHNQRSALFEIIRAMMNPMVVPSSCRDQCIVEVMIHALLESPSLLLSEQRNRIHGISSPSVTTSRWTPSQLLLLETISTLSKGPILLDSFLTNHVDRFSLCSDATTPNKVNRILSAIYWLKTSSSLTCPLLERELIRSALLLLRRIDSWDTKLKTKQPSGGETSCPVCCQGIPDGRTVHQRRTRSKMKAGSLSNLHDDELKLEGHQGLYKHPASFWRASYEQRTPKVSLKDVLTKGNPRQIMAHTTICRCINDGRIPQHGHTSKAKRTTFLSQDWSIVRSRAYKKIVSMLVDQQRPNQISLLQIDLHRLVQSSILSIESPSIRVCLLLLANTMGGPKNPTYFLMIARFYWDVYSSSQETIMPADLKSGALRLYSEWLCECAIFDQPETAWEGFQPLLRHFQEWFHKRRSFKNDFFDENDDDDSRWNAEEISKYMDPSLLACLAYILRRRSHLFQNDFGTMQSDGRHEREFQSFVDNLSIFCGESSEPWLQLYSCESRDRIENSLQGLGILSFSSCDRNNTMQSSVQMESLSCSTVRSMATEDWPVSQEFGMRKAMFRIDHSVLSLEGGRDRVTSLLARLTNSCHRDKMLSKRDEAQSQKTKTPPPPMANYIYDSGILYIVFSFCGPNELAKIPQVCQSWKVVTDTASNVLWEAAYSSKFGEYRWPSVETDRRNKGYWKNAFFRKDITEKLIRFQRNSRTGFKYRTCNYVGCLQIFKSADQERKHYRMHMRQFKKKRTKQKSGGEKQS